MFEHTSTLLLTVLRQRAVDSCNYECQTSCSRVAKLPETDIQVNPEGN